MFRFVVILEWSWVWGASKSNIFKVVTSIVSALSCDFGCYSDIFSVILYTYFTSVLFASTDGHLIRCQDPIFYRQFENNYSDELVANVSNL